VEDLELFTSDHLLKDILHLVSITSTKSLSHAEPSRHKEVLDHVDLLLLCVLGAIDDIVDSCPFGLVSFSQVLRETSQAQFVDKFPLLCYIVEDQVFQLLS
jgi:hypothetical protein